MIRNTLRHEAPSTNFGNDSIHVQFSDAVDAAGSALYRIGSSGASNSAQVVLQEVLRLSDPLINNQVPRWAQFLFDFLRPMCLEDLGR